MRAWSCTALLTAGALASAGCGTGEARQHHHPGPEVINAGFARTTLRHLVRRAGVSGASFLVPRSMDFAYVDLVSDPVLFGDTTTAMTTRDRSVQATITHPGRVEIIADAAPGTLTRISWRTACAPVSPRHRADTGPNPPDPEANRVTAMVPAVIRVRLPDQGAPDQTCRISAMLYTRSRTPAQLALLGL